MSQTRQQADETGFVVRTLAVNYRGGTRLEPHAHDWPQLVYAAQGVMTVEVDAEFWVVPPHRAVWVPAHRRHSIEMTGTVAMRSVYICGDLEPDMPDRCETVEISALLRELILHISRLGMLHREDPIQARLIGVLLDQLKVIRVLELRLPMPETSRLRLATERLRQDPSQDSTLEDVAAMAHLSTRTVERLFVAETQLTFVQWRQRMRLLHALQRLASGESVTQVALAIGYQAASAFIAAFKREFGVTPKHYHGKK